MSIQTEQMGGRRNTFHAGISKYQVDAYRGENSGGKHFERDFRKTDERNRFFQRKAEGSSKLCAKIPGRVRRAFWMVECLLLGELTRQKTGCELQVLKAI